MPDDSGYTAIVIMAALTFALRIGGLVLGRHVPASGRPAELLEQLPGIILAALVAPAVLELGWPGLAGVIAAAAAWRASGGNLLAAIVAGSATVAACRVV